MLILWGSYYFYTQYIKWRNRLRDYLLKATHPVSGISSIQTLWRSLSKRTVLSGLGLFSIPGFPFTSVPPHPTPMPSHPRSRNRSQTRDSILQPTRWPGQRSQPYFSSSSPLPLKPRNICRAVTGKLSGKGSFLMTTGLPQGPSPCSKERHSSSLQCWLAPLPRNWDPGEDEGNSSQSQISTLSPARMVYPRAPKIHFKSEIFLTALNRSRKKKSLEQRRKLFP